MKIGFGEIPDNGLRLEIHDETWFPDQEIERQGPVKAGVFLERKGLERVLLSGEIETVALLVCDRCLTDFKADLGGKFRIDLELLPDDRLPAAEHECGATEMDVVYLTKPVLDVFELLAQQLFLMMPSKKLCAEECKGLCRHCGANLNVESCRCRQGTENSPFNVLAGLKGRGSRS